MVTCSIVWWDVCLRNLCYATIHSLRRVHSRAIQTLRSFARSLETCVLRLVGNTWRNSSEPSVPDRSEPCTGPDRLWLVSVRFEALLAVSTIRLRETFRGDSRIHRLSTSSSRTVIRHWSGIPRGCWSSVDRDRNRGWRIHYRHLVDRSSLSGRNTLWIGGRGTWLAISEV